MNHIGQNLDASKFNPNSPNYIGDKTVLMQENVAAGKYTTIYHEVAAEFCLDPLDSMILFTIWALSHKKAYCYMSKEAMAKLLLVKPSTLYIHLKKLKGKGLAENFNGSRTKLALTSKAAQAVLKAKAKVDASKKGMNKVLI